MKRFLKILFPVLTFSVMVFILSNSLSSQKKVVETTHNIAGAVEEKIEQITDEKVTLSDKQKVIIVKLGHLSEFMLFALFLTLSVFFLGGDPKAMCHSIILCVVILALADEQLQILGDKRGSRISDAIIDLAGGILGYATGRGVTFLVKRKVSR